MVEVSNADRVVFSAIGRTKGDVVAYYERIAPRALPHLLDRPLSIRRYPKGLAAAGFFQKNVPAHYPQSIARFAIPRSREATKKHKGKGASDRDLTLYPLIDSQEHLAYLANQGAIELHIPTFRTRDTFRPDRLVIDLDPPAGEFERVRRAAMITRDALGEYGLRSVPVATGSKGYHVVAAVTPTLGADQIATASARFAALLAAAHPDELTTTYRIALRGQRVFVDWLRNNPMASVVAPYSLRATPNANVATPLSWDELASHDPDAFSIADIERLLDRTDALAELAQAPSDPSGFAGAVETAFASSGLVLETFDRFRS